MSSSKKGSNTLCVVSFLFILLGIGLYCVFKPPPLQETVKDDPEERIRTSIADLGARGEGMPGAEDNIELINA